MNVVGTAGHVDHGKSTLVQALTGMDPDRFEEEKRRGLTIDLGFAWMDLPSGREIGIVDVPGHERFIRNMLTGVGAVDAALFVVAADEGWMPQSAEHLQILDFLQVRTGVVALTKADLVDAEILDVLSDEIRERLHGTALEGAAIVPVSSTQRKGLKELAKALGSALDGVPPPADHRRPRLFVDRAFTITGAGTVVTGTLTGGRLRAGVEVEALPSGLRSRIRGLQTHRKPVDEAVPGNRLAVNLVGVEKDHIRRGEALVLPDQWKQTNTFAARLWTARDLTHPLTERGAYELYLGAAEMQSRVKFLEDPPDAGDRNPGLGAGESLLVQVFCLRPLPVMPGDRFVVRDLGRWETVAGGVVLDSAPGRLRRGDEAALERLRARASVSGPELVGRIVAERKVVARADLGSLSGIGQEEAEMALAEAEGSGRLFRTASYVLDTDHHAGLRESATFTLDEHHSAHPLDEGMPREALRRELGMEPRLFSELLERWSAEGLLEAAGSAVRLPGHGPSLAAEQREQADRALSSLREGGSSPPSVKELGLALDLLKALERSGELVLISADIAYPTETLKGIEERVVRLISERGPVTVSEAREAIGTTRKYAVPLLEYLDGRGITRRQEDRRTLGPRGREIAERQSNG